MPCTPPVRPLPRARMPSPPPSSFSLSTLSTSPTAAKLLGKLLESMPQHVRTRIPSQDRGTFCSSSSPISCASQSTSGLRRFSSALTLLCSQRVIKSARELSTPATCLAWKHHFPFTSSAPRILISPLARSSSLPPSAIRHPLDGQGVIPFHQHRSPP